MCGDIESLVSLRGLAFHIAKLLIDLIVVEGNLGREQLPHRLPTTYTKGPDPCQGLFLCPLVCPTQFITQFDICVKVQQEKSRPS